MLPFSIIPKEYRGVAILVGAAIAGLTMYKLYTDIQINKERLDDYSEED